MSMQKYKQYRVILLPIFVLSVFISGYYLGKLRKTSTEVMANVTSNTPQAVNLGKYHFIQHFNLDNGKTASLIQEQSEIDGRAIEDCQPYGDKCVEWHSRLNIYDKEGDKAESNHFKHILTSSSEVIPINIGDEEFYWVNWLDMGLHSSNAILLNRTGSKLEIVCRDFDLTVLKNEDGQYPRNDCSFWTDEGTPSLEDRNNDGMVEIYEDSRNYEDLTSAVGHLVTKFNNGKFITSLNREK